MHGNLFFDNGNQSCIKTKVFAKKYARNTKLENQGMELVDIHQAKYVVRYAEYSCQEMYAMTEKVGLQQMKL